jgi:hypothetical protein
VLAINQHQPGANAMTSIALQGNLPRHYFFGYRRSELDELFEQLESPAQGELDGVYPGALFAIKLVDSIPVIRRILYWILDTFLVPWTGKRFDGDSGANYWLTGSGRFTFGEYDIEQATGSDEPIQLNYDVDRNMGLLRPIRGEVKKVSDGTYLARMLYKTKNKTHTVAYFTLQQES